MLDADVPGELRFEALVVLVRLAVPGSRHGVGDVLNLLRGDPRSRDRDACHAKSLVVL